MAMDGVEASAVDMRMPNGSAATLSAGESAVSVGPLPLADARLAELPSAAGEREGKGRPVALRSG
eukprot:scaffold287892_cov44-Tisochrysis_lutea.AAC.1